MRLMAPPGESLAPVDFSGVEEVVDKVEAANVPAKRFASRRDGLLAAAALGLAVTGQLTGVLASPPLARLTGEATYQAIERLDQEGDWLGAYQGDALSPGQAYRKARSWFLESYDGPRLYYRFPDQTTYRIQDSETIEQLEAYLLDGDSLGYSDEDIEMFRRLSNLGEIGEAFWDSEGASLALDLQRYSRIRALFRFGDSNFHKEFRNLEELRLFDAVYSGTDNGTVSPELREAALELARHSRGDAHDLIQAARSGHRSAYRVTYTGGPFQRPFGWALNSEADFLQAARQMRNQKEVDTYRLAPEALAEQAAPFLETLSLVSEATKAQALALTSVEGLSPGMEEAVGLEEATSRVREAFSDWDYSDEAAAEEVREALVYLNEASASSDWWSPFNSAQAELIRAQAQKLEILRQTTERPAPPDGWQAPTDLPEPVS